MCIWLFWAADVDTILYKLTNNDIAAHRNCDIGRDNHIYDGAYLCMTKFSLPKFQKKSLVCLGDSPRFLTCLLSAHPVIRCYCARMHFPGMVST